MRRQLYTGGGIASLQRQGYFLGGITDILGKAGKVVKQIVKSDVGKAALLGATMYGLGGGCGLKPGGFARGKLPGASFFGKGSFNPLRRVVGADKDIAQSAFSKFLGGNVGKTALAGTAAALAFAGVPNPTESEGFKMAQRKGNVEEYLRRYYKKYKQADRQEGWNQDEEDEFVSTYTNYNQGGRVGLQAGGLPVPDKTYNVDPRMHRNLEENVRMNNIQREMNERVKKGSRVRGLDLKNRFVNRVAEGPTGAQMYGINAQPYMMNTPTTPINQAIFMEATLTKD